ncbi:MAG: histidine kinase N-terminal 7TM domain-containing protein [Eubacteriales bacterium]
MRKVNKSVVRNIVIISLLVIVAYLCRLPQIRTYSPDVCRHIRSLIYLSLFSAWYISLRNRIIQIEVRKYLTSVSILMILWLLFRTIKYNIETNPNIARYMWYLYYLPLLFIPILAVFVALSLGRPESYQLPKQALLLIIPAVLMFAMVITNDLHMCVFEFPANAKVWTDDDYSYGFGYFTVLGYIILNTVAAFAIMLIKCRLPHSKRYIWMPLVPLSIALVYSTLYAMKIPFISYYAGDSTITYCILFIIILESLIASGLIQSNTNYTELLTACTTGIWITDNDYHTRLSSAVAADITSDTMRQTENGSIMLSGGLRLSEKKISGGHVLWTDNVSELLSVLDELNDTNDYLADENNLIREEYAMKTKEAHIAEQDRLYDIIQKQTERQIRLLTELTDQFDATESENEKRRLLGKMVVIGAYLKRKSNLILLADKEPMLDAVEIGLTFNESLDNMELYGISCGFRSDIEGSIPAESVIKMYDLFESIAEFALDKMQTITVLLTRKRAGFQMRINTDADEDFSRFSSDFTEALRDDDGEWQITAYIGGEPT